MLKTNNSLRIWLIFLGLALPVLIVFYPLLFQNQIFADSDTILQTYPAAHFLQQALINNESFLWTPQVLTGFPLTASFLGGFFSPLYQLLFKNFDVYNTYNWLTAINFILTGLLVYALTRRLKLSQNAALLTGLTLPLTTAYWLFKANLTVTSTYWILPGLFLVSLIISQTVSKFKIISTTLIGGVLLGLTFLNGHPQWPLQALAINIIFAFCLDWRCRSKIKFKISDWKTLGANLIISLLGLLIALPQFLASQAISVFSARSEGLPFAQAATGSLIPGDFLSFILPSINLPVLIAKPGFLYIGAAGLLLAIISLWSKKDFYYKFFLSTFIITLLISVKYSPLFWLFHQLPVFSAFREPSRFMYIGLLALVIMSAYGFDYLINNKNKLTKPVKKLWQGILILTGLLVIWQGIIFLWGQKILNFGINYFNSKLYSNTTGLPLEHYHRVINQLYDTLLQGTTLYGPVFVIGAFSLILSGLVIYLWQQGKISKTFISSSILIITVINLVGIKLIDQAYVPKRLISQTPVYLQKLKNLNDQPFRVWGFLPGTSIFQKLDTPFGYEPQANLELQQALLNPNMNILYGVDSLDYYDNIMDRRQARLLGYLGSDRSTFGESLASENISLDEKKELFLTRLNLLSVFNVKYIFSLFKLSNKQLKLISTNLTTQHQIPVYTYENSAVLPRYYLTKNIIVSPILKEEASWQNLINNLDLITKTTLIECSNCSQTKSNSKITDITPIKQNNTKFEFSINNQMDQWFIFGQNFLPGWQAQIDNQLTNIYRANYINQAIFIHAGQHVVKFIYEGP